MLPRLLLMLAICLPTAWAQMRLSSPATQAGYRLTTFADNFPQASGIGPVGIAFPDSGGVLVSDYPGNIRRFPNRNDNQRANTAPAVVDLGTGGGGGMAKSGGRIYATDQLLGRLLLLNDNGTLNQVVVASGFTNGAGLATHPLNGRIFVSIRDAGVPDRIVDFNPTTRTFTTFKNNVTADGLAFSPDGAVLYAAALDTGRVLGYRLADATQVFDSDVITGADGIAVGAGVLSGQLFVNTNDGRVVQVDLKTAAQTVLASGGSRGGLVATDPNDNSLLLTQSDRILRLSPPAGAAFGGSGDGQLLTNGSFDSGGFAACNNGSYCRLAAGSGGMPAWQVGGVGVDWHNNSEMQNPHGGALAVDLHTDGRLAQGGTISQTFTTLIGQRYLLTFYFAGPGLDPELRNPRQIAVSVAGVQQTYTTPASANTRIEWSKQQLTFAATATTTTLAFSSPANGVGYWGPLLDDVSVLPTDAAITPPTPPTPATQLSLSSQATQAGFRLTTFVDLFPSAPLGIAFPNSGGVLVTEGAGFVRRFLTNADGQHANAVTPALALGAKATAGLAKAGGVIYLGDAASARLLQLNDNGTLNQVVFPNNLPSPYGLAAHPGNGHLFVATRYGNDPDKIVDIDLTTRTVTAFKTGVPADGIAFSPDGTVLYASIYDERTTSKSPDNGHILGFRLSDGVRVFDSGLIAGSPAGCAVGTGSLAGYLFVNNNDGRVIQVDLRTNAQTVIATGGSRGDLIAVDPSDGSLLLTQTDRILRLTPPAGGAFGIPPAPVVDPTIPLRLTPQGGQSGLVLTTFADRFQSTEGQGPFGIEFPDSGGVLVTNVDGTIIRFPTADNGQRADSLVPLQSHGYGEAIGLAKLNGRIYMTQAISGRVVLLNDDASISKVMVTGLTHALGIAANPVNGHIYAAGQGTIADLDPETGVVTVFARVGGDGVTISPDGQTLYAEVDGHILGFRISDRTRVFDSGLISNADGCAVGTGAFAGQLFVNTKDGRLVRVILATGAQTVLASGGSRGDFVTPAPDGSLFITQSDRILRLSTSNGGGFGGTPYSLSLNTTTMTAAGGTGSVTVTVSVPTLTWTASTSAGWITITSTVSGTGNGTVAYRVAANPSTSPRTGTLTIAGLLFTITQGGAAVIGTGGEGDVLPPPGTNCLSGAVDYVTFSLQNKASRLADEISIGGTKLCADCKLKPPLFGGFAERLEAARLDGLNVDVCYDEYGTLNYLRMRP